MILIKYYFISSQFISNKMKSISNILIFISYTKVRWGIFFLESICESILETHVWWKSTKSTRMRVHLHINLQYVFLWCSNLSMPFRASMLHMRSVCVRSTCRAEQRTSNTLIYYIISMTNYLSPSQSCTQYALFKVSPSHNIHSMWLVNIFSYMYLGKVHWSKSTFYK